MDRDGALGGPDSARPRGRSLVVLAPSRDAIGHQRCSRPSAEFLAHLIATAQQVPQTRARRRAGPEAATALYATGPIATAGRSLRWSM
jgi:hypothetical protein